jgi:endonuclease/exonuclease/phosphatase family metal-dependent hydrolase
VYSVNAGSFYPNRYSEKTDDSLRLKSFYRWVESESENIDVLCLQEFYHHSQRETWNTLDSIRILGDFSYIYMNPTKIGAFDGFFGVTTFSKHKFAFSDSLVYGKGTLNKGVYNDIVMNNDTIRVINLHLKSMSIRWNKQDNDFFKTLSTNYNNLRSGYLERLEEVKHINKLVRKSPHPVIVCGDFNEVPYGNVYYKLRNELNDAFIDSGKGLGFTYSEFPFIIRIDHQFYSNNLKSIFFKVHNNVNISDHYPIESHYIYKNKRGN